MGVMRTLFTHRNDKELSSSIETLRRVLKHDFAKYWMMTSSRIYIPAEGPDRVVHGIDREAHKQRIVTGNITGKDGYLNDHEKEVTRLMLGTTPDEANEIYGKWINNHRTVEFTDSQNPKRGELERALMLARFVVIAGIFANYDIGGVARGWAPKNSTENRGGA